MIRTVSVCDVRYRDIGWRVFHRIEQHCRVKSGGFSGLKNVNVNESSEFNLGDAMPSFFVAETLKYLFSCSSHRQTCMR